MKRFLKKTTFFLIFVFAMSYVLDYAICDGLLKMEDGRFMSWADCKKGNATSDVVIIGNSRALSHFEPMTIDSICHLSAFNLGTGGYAINVDLLKYRFYREHNTAPKIIVFEVGHIVMQIWEARQHFQSEQFFPLFHDYAMKSELVKVGYSYLDVLVPLYRIWGYQDIIKKGIYEFLGKEHYRTFPTERGLSYERGEWDGTELAKHKVIDGSMNAEAKVLFEDFMEECKSQKIKVILVKSPMYIGRTRKTTHLKEEREYFQSMAKKYNTVFLDYSVNYPLCNDTTKFVAAVHLNPIGAHLFSIDFADTLNTILHCSKQK